MADRAFYKCPDCDEVIEGEMVVDPTFGERVDLHKTRHDPELVEKMKDATLISALTLYALQAADPSHAIILLEQMGCDGAAEIVLAGRERERSRLYLLDGDVMVRVIKGEAPIDAVPVGGHSWRAR